jgi:glycosyltransferase involved in cell wall biosynthesis
LLSKSDIQVVGSLSEGLPLMVLEAAACGVPTIGTKIGGMDEAIVDGETGLLVERCSSQALAYATAWLLDHPDDRNQMAQAARKHVAKNFDSEKHIADLLGLLRSDFNVRMRNAH